jgi:hypothetical protein
VVKVKSKPGLSLSAIESAPTNVGPNASKDISVPLGLNNWQP